jgi:hypothetical protein
MRIWKFDTARVSALLLAVAIATPATVSADIFAWRTEDGVFAYTDDRENIPSRYADEAVSVPDSRLRAYKRLTVEDSASTREVTTRLERRLDYLRQLNAAPPAPPRDVAATGGSAVISVATGNAQAPTLDIATDSDAGPIVVEPITTKESCKVRTRSATIVKQGDRTLAIVKSRSHHHNVNDDIHDEDDLLEGSR